MNEVLNDEKPEEVDTAILKRMADIVYLLDRGIYCGYQESNIKVKKVLAPIYNFLKAFHHELNEASINPNYSFNSIDEPELPDLSTLDEHDKSTLNNIVDTIVEALPSIVDLINNLEKTAYPYEREVAIAVNTIDAFCKKLSHA